MRKGKVGLYLALVSTMLVGSVYGAVTITPIHRVFETMLAGTLVVTSSMTPTDAGFYVSNIDLAAAGTTAATAAQFPSTVGPSPDANTAITTGDFVLFMFFAATSSTPASSTFSVTLRVLTSTVQVFSILYVATGSTVTPGALVRVSIDVGPALNTPIAYTVQVEKL